VHGKPDWGMVGPKATVYGMDDMGELAVRMGSPVMWDRRGDVILFDSFEGGGVQSFSGTTGVGDYYRTRAGVSVHGPLARYFYLAGAVNSDGYVSWYCTPTSIMVNGFEASVGYDQNIDHFGIALSYLDGANEYRASVHYFPATDVLAYQTGAAAWTTFATNVALWLVLHPFHVFKVVVDFDNLQFVRAIVNDVTYDLLGIGLYTRGQMVGPCLQGRVHFVSDQVGLSECAVDRAVLTHNEPI
jgi:hypothetical protein